MEEEVRKLIAALLLQTKEHVPDYGDFSPVMEFMDNPDPRTQEFVGKYGLRVYKMPKDVVPDPRKRYVEAAAYVPSGMYKCDRTVASGTKDEIIHTMQTEEFVKKLCEKLPGLGEVFEHYD